MKRKLGKKERYKTTEEKQGERKIKKASGENRCKIEENKYAKTEDMRKGKEKEVGENI